VQEPLLSICLATYNATHLLRVALEAALPQVAAANGKVELLVVDDASTDDTASVVGVASALGPVRYERNPSNLGVNANLVHGPSRLARGRFVWVWNQHCLLRPGALARLLAVLETHPSLDVFYGNFRCASYPDDWPETVPGGYDGAFRYLLHGDLADRPVNRWSDLLAAATCVCTQSYAHIVRRGIWTEYWQKRSVGVSFRDAPSSYPHTCMLVDCVFDRPSVFIGEPLITIFNGAQSWKALPSRAGVYLRGFPELMTILKRRGWAPNKRHAAEKWGAHYAGEVVEQALRARSGKVLRMIPAYLWRFGLQRGVLGECVNAVLRVFCPGLLRASKFVKQCWQEARAYLFENCRPARWWRARRNQGLRSFLCL
jgi:hypothetical protein